MPIRAVTATAATLTDALSFAMKGAVVFLQEDEVEPMCRYASQAGTIVEIGTACGASTTLFLMSAPADAEVHSIDPFVQDSYAPWFTGSASRARKHIRAAAAHFGFDMRRWTLHQQFSYDLAPTWTKPIDLLLIDGDHRYRQVTRDFRQWFPKVRRGGVILLHDSRREPGTPRGEAGQGWPGSTRLANELRHDPRVELAEEVFSLTVWRKAAGDEGSLVARKPARAPRRGAARSRRAPPASGRRRRR